MRVLKLSEEQFSWWVQEGASSTWLFGEAEAWFDSAETEEVSADCDAEPTRSDIPQNRSPPWIRTAGLNVLRKAFRSSWAAERAEKLA